MKAVGHSVTAKMMAAIALRASGQLPSQPYKKS